MADRDPDPGPELSLKNKAKIAFANPLRIIKRARSTHLFIVAHIKVAFKILERNYKQVLTRMTDRYRTEQKYLIREIAVLCAGYCLICSP